MASSEAELREKLRKIRALFEGASTPGERQAAEAAMERLQRALNDAGPSQQQQQQQWKPPYNPFRPTRAETPVEWQVTLADRWQRRLFMALCRQYGLKPYRYKRQRHTTVMIKVLPTVFNLQLWPEYLELRDALNEYLDEATERIIREEIFGDTGEASEYF
ncbi:MAG: hypothetical protein IT162_08670 [Bryobacterales bacterium]|nr:hypothetical protein [Bryobacterales bacterium]